MSDLAKCTFQLILHFGFCIYSQVIFKMAFEKECVIVVNVRSKTFTIYN